MLMFLTLATLLIVRLVRLLTECMLCLVSPLVTLVATLLRLSSGPLLSVLLRVSTRASSVLWVCVCSLLMTLLLNLLIESSLDGGMQVTLLIDEKFLRIRTDVTLLLILSPLTNSPPVVLRLVLSPVRMLVRATMPSR